MGNTVPAIGESPLDGLLAGFDTGDCLSQNCGGRARIVARLTAASVGVDRLHDGT